MVDFTEINLNNSNSNQNQKTAAEEEDKKSKRERSRRRGKSAGREIPPGRTTPDPTAERDLDNASPETTEFCSNFPCHYCIYVYIASNEVCCKLAAEMECQ